MNRKKSLRLSGLPLVALLVAQCLLPLLAACGKKDYPQPQDDFRAFAWDEVEAKSAGSCLAFTGKFKGAYSNFDGVRVEIAPVNGPEDCPGCPFVPEEVTELSASDVAFDPDAGTVSFTYCPRKAKAYRWRLAGMNQYNRLPHATMNDRLTIVDPDLSEESLTAPKTRSLDTDQDRQKSARAVLPDSGQSGASSLNQEERPASPKADSELEYRVPGRSAGASGASSESRAAGGR